MRKSIPAVLAGVMIIGGLLMPGAQADHEPANKVAASGSVLEAMNATEGSRVVLRERVKVSSSHDLILSLSSECSILTALRTGDDEDAGLPAASTDTARAFGELEMFISIDGRVVPVTSMDSSPSGPTNAGDPGRVVFCNREYQRTVTNSETEDDGLDTEEDFIRTRTANAFNWLALDVGFNYDDSCTEAGEGCAEVLPANGNNVVDIAVWADYERNPEQCTGPVPSPSDVNDACAQAIVGKRTLIVEPTNASNHEWVTPGVDPDPTPAP